MATLFLISPHHEAITEPLLQNMIERGEMKLDDPVSTYLPSSTGMPTRNGRVITLRHLVTHTSGLPHIADNLNPKRADHFANYTVEVEYFSLELPVARDPGAKFEYSAWAGLLGHVIA
jgi:CubicO group peptidase (beta-lactamase class C family)